MPALPRPRRDGRGRRWLAGPAGLRLAAAAVVLLALAAAGCARDFPQTALVPRSDFGRVTNDLTRFLVFWVAVIFTVVEAVLVFTVLRFRARHRPGEPSTRHGNVPLEVAWTIAPALILTAVAIPTVRGIFRTQADAPPAALQVNVIAHQWWWEFRYPRLNVTTANELHVPVGRPVALALESADVIHSFWVPAMGGKRDVVPGHVNRLVFTPSSVGRLPGQCAEFCGVSHANMRMTMVVESPADFERWVRAQQAPPPEPDSLSAAGRGKQVFLTAGCAGCHTVRGVAPGQIGPDLTHVAGRGTIAAGLYPNTPGMLAAWIEDPPTRKPGTLMPKLGLPPAQVADVVAYLRTLR